MPGSRLATVTYSVVTTLLDGHSQTPTGNVFDVQGPVSPGATLTQLPPEQIARDVPPTGVHSCVHDLPVADPASVKQAVVSAQSLCSRHGKPSPTSPDVAQSNSVALTETQVEPLAHGKGCA